MRLSIYSRLSEIISDSFRAVSGEDQRGNTLSEVGGKHGRNFIAWVQILVFPPRILINKQKIMQLSYIWTETGCYSD